MKSESFTSLKEDLEILEKRQSEISNAFLTVLFFSIFSYDWRRIEMPISPFEKEHEEIVQKKKIKVVEVKKDVDERG